MSLYHPWGKKAGILVDKDDTNYRPLSQCRSTVVYLDEEDKLTVMMWGLPGDTLVIPFPEWTKMLTEEKDKELGVDLIKRIAKMDITTNPITRVNSY